MKVFHAKTHGCVMGTLAVESHLPASLSAGLFGMNVSSSIPAIIRYSNGIGTTTTVDATKANDLKPDVRGMAVKLFMNGLAGNKDCSATPQQCNDNTLDFISFTAPTFFGDNVDHITEGAIAGIQGKIKNFLLQHIPYIFTVMKMGVSGIVSNIFSATFNSAVPIAMGDHSAAQLRWVPCHKSFTFPNFLKGAQLFHDQIVATVAKSEVCVQLEGLAFENQKVTPIEVNDVDWSKKAKGKWTKLATLTIPKQKADIDLSFCANVAFNTWNTVPDNRPLGPMARVRKGIYARSAQKRIQIQTGHAWEHDISLADVQAARPSGGAHVDSVEEEHVMPVQEEHREHAAHHGRVSVHVEVDA